MTRNRVRQPAAASPLTGPAALGEQERAALAQADALGWSVFVEAAGELLRLAQGHPSRRLVIILGGSVEAEGAAAFYDG